MSSWRRSSRPTPLLVGSSWTVIRARRRRPPAWSVPWTRTVVVEPVDPDTLGSLGGDVGLVRVSVTVADAEGAALTVSTLRCTGDAVARTSPIDVTPVAGVTITLVTGDGTTAVREMPVLSAPLDAPEGG